MSRSCGLLGLPSAGKSTLLNALTASEVAAVGNYPFCTLKANAARVNVPDARLLRLTEIGGSKRTIFEQIEVVDIPGLIEGAGSSGKGKGNQFLADVRETSALLHVVRCFEDPDVIHVRSEEASSNLDPEKDMDVINAELILADLQSLERRKSRAASDQKLVDRIVPLLEDGLPARVLLQDDPDLRLETEWRQLHLLTQKPVVYVCNIDEESLTTPCSYIDIVRERATTENAGFAIISAKLEMEAAEFTDEEARREFLKDCGVTVTGLESITKAAMDALQLQTFFTVGPQEARAWMISKGSTAKEAAAKIHTDISKNFIKAETTAFNDLVQAGSIENAKSKGLTRSEGANYIVQDADVILFRHR